MATLIHQWTHTGKEVLIVKCVGPQGETHDGFRWPMTVGAAVQPTEWRPTAECGHGLHGRPGGLALGGGKDPDWSATWIVFGAQPADVVDLGGKVKARCGIVRYVGDWQGATTFVLQGQIAWVVQASDGSGRATGPSSASSATG